MSAHASSAPPANPLLSTPSSPSSVFASLGIPLAVAVALAFLVLLSSFLLASYICCRRRNPTSYPSAAPADPNVSPRIIFVAEEDAGDAGGQPMGLDQAVISAYPMFPFSAAKGGDTVCSICLCEYRDGEMLRMMPECAHYFHLLCIDVWLRLNASCPVCRTSPLPTPVSTPISTPLSELVPLSQFAADRRRRN